MPYRIYRLADHRICQSYTIYIMDSVHINSSYYKGAEGYVMCVGLAKAIVALFGYSGAVAQSTSKNSEKNFPI